MLLPENGLNLLRVWGEGCFNLENVLADGVEDGFQGQGREVTVHQHTVFLWIGKIFSSTLIIPFPDGTIIFFSLIIFNKYRVFYVFFLV